MNGPVSVTLPRESWRTIHAALIEMCVLWDAGAGWAVLPSPVPEQVRDVMQRIAPVIGTAAAWPDGASTEATARAVLGLPVPEDALHLARGLVAEAPDEWADPLPF
jgi:hypothetical protein